MTLREKLIIEKSIWPSNMIENWFLDSIATDYDEKQILSLIEKYYIIPKRDDICELTASEKKSIGFGT